ncbi:dTMP kinase [Phascolarctobacterium sp.]|uniref:dTMP kinase n=1 Tax=Phascolarctobacterium sp. TaxID=2049039 RepID=UPI003862FB11
MKQGLLITFEGVDGGGKSTQLLLAAEYLRSLGYEVVTTREPGGTLLAEQVRSIVLDAALPLTTTTQTLLYLAARSEHVDKLVRPALAAEKIVLCDRFSDSTMVYQGLCHGKTLAELGELRQLNLFATENLVPDLTLVFDGRPEVLVERRNLRGVTDRYEQEGLEFQQRLRAGFLTLAQAEPERIRIVDAEGSMGAVAAKVRVVLDEALQVAKDVE